MTIEQIVEDFGVHPMTLTKWLRRADIDERAKPGSPVHDDLGAATDDDGESAGVHRRHHRTQAR
ncbi:hypothetical protein [Acidipropionibacterium jensenii]|uniref:hypothetical protein n=1 Tax=Acidipropionibacterium jensenii TaxID=1749 RepID=UPI00264941D5|nr:hypothetical protein [Acidipropionibacterium jensenii]MDN6592336.1 hypothetical protein [Acidipropionibacterium jensenii]MDN6625099.1 hypothetical protein [Acidipropionibacterium jensenii]MDN6811284.1 hypothetical protein [Acidipropionibacterium jensenii]